MSAVIYSFALRTDFFRMDIALIVFGAIALLIGLLGCVLPMLPGPPLAYAALLLLHFTDRVQFSWTQLLVWLALTLVVQALDFIVPMLGTKYSGGSRWGKNGCIIGTLIGLFFMPWGIVLGPFLGALIGELLAGRTGNEAIRSGVGSLLGFLLGTVVKVALCVYFCWTFFVALF